ncbi:hypothetical protein AE621_25605 [Acidovorax sp. SD340]|nr:hypothetical protein AE621_25605 [Acidovorax sp. SD340]
MCNQIAADEDFDLVAHPGKIDPPEDPIGRHGRKRQQVARAPGLAGVGLVPEMWKRHQPRPGFGAIGFEVRMGLRNRPYLRLGMHRAAEKHPQHRNPEHAQRCLPRHAR